MIWIFFLILTILFWGSYNLFFKFLNGQMNYFFALIIISSVQLVVSIPFVLHQFSIGSVSYSTKGIILSLLMGFLITAGTIFFFYTFQFGASSSIAIPIYSIGALILGVFGGILIYGETLSVQSLIGIVLGFISIILIAWK